MYLLDTNVLSALRKVADQRNEPVHAWAHGQDTASLFISVVSLLEIRRGIHLLEKRNDQFQAALLSVWLENHVLPAFAGRILVVSQAVVLRAATLPWSSPNDYRDALLVATALVHGAAVVTRKTKHFEATGVTLIDPWRPVKSGRATI
ncbi:MAG: type II toxin-antitoxin system VapC family toxin [Nevskiaceae bacterium]|jgi:predicted nucleic acid-binding protein|nr:type II toxin-antitoxin system VapC family toxin [Nevskiaceae bacterium]